MGFNGHKEDLGTPAPAVPQFENQLLHTQISNAVARWTDVFPPFTPIRGARYNIPIKVALRIGLLRGIRRLVSDSVPAIAVDSSRTVSLVASKMKMEAHCLLLPQFEIVVCKGGARDSYCPRLGC